MVRRKYIVFWFAVNYTFARRGFACRGLGVAEWPYIIEFPVHIVKSKESAW